MIDFGNHYYVAQIWVLSLGTCCPPREQRLLISCSSVPHHVIPEGPLEGHSRNFSCILNTNPLRKEAVAY